MLPDVLSVSIRGLSFILLFQAIGSAFFTTLFGQIQNSILAVRRLTMITAIGGAVTIVLHLVLEGTRMTGEFSSVLDAAMQQRVITSAIATSHALQVLGLLLVAWACRQDRHRAVVSGMGGAIAIMAFLLVGHTSVHPWRVVLAPLLILHLLVGAFWFGSLLPLWIVLRRESIPVAAAVLREFSAMATWLVPVIAIAGLVMMLLIANGIPSLQDPYGELILAKIISFVILMGLAALNKWRLAPAIASDAGKSRSALRHSVIMEMSLIVCVLGITAVMTTFFSPNE